MISPIQNTPLSQADQTPNIAQAPPSGFRFLREWPELSPKAIHAWLDTPLKIHNKEKTDTVDTSLRELLKRAAYFPGGVDHILLFGSMLYALLFQTELPEDADIKIIPKEPPSMDDMITWRDDWGCKLLKPTGSLEEFNSIRSHWMKKKNVRWQAHQECNDRFATVTFYVQNKPDIELLLVNHIDQEGLYRSETPMLDLLPYVMNSSCNETPKLLGKEIDPLIAIQDWKEKKLVPIEGRRFGINEWVRLQTRKMRGHHLESAIEEQAIVDKLLEEPNGLTQLLRKLSKMKRNGLRDADERLLSLQLCTSLQLAKNQEKAKEWEQELFPKEKASLLLLDILQPPYSQEAYKNLEQLIPFLHEPVDEKSMTGFLFNNLQTVSSKELAQRKRILDACIQKKLLAVNSTRTLQLAAAIASMLFRFKIIKEESAVRYFLSFCRHSNWKFPNSKEECALIDPLNRLAESFSTRLATLTEWDKSDCRLAALLIRSSVTRTLPPNFLLQAAKHPDLAECLVEHFVHFAPTLPKDKCIELLLIFREQFLKAPPSLLEAWGNELLAARKYKDAFLFYDRANIPPKNFIAKTQIKEVLNKLAAIASWGSEDSVLAACLMNSSALEELPSAFFLKTAKHQGLTNCLMDHFTGFAHKLSQNERIALLVQFQEQILKLDSSNFPQWGDELLEKNYYKEALLFYEQAKLSPQDLAVKLIKWCQSASNPELFWNVWIKHQKTLLEYEDKKPVQELINEKFSEQLNASDSPLYINRVYEELLKLSPPPEKTWALLISKIFRTKHPLRGQFPGLLPEITEQAKLPQNIAISCWETALHESRPNEKKQIRLWIDTFLQLPGTQRRHADWSSFLFALATKAFSVPFFESEFFKVSFNKQQGKNKQTLGSAYIRWCMQHKNYEEGVSFFQSCFLPVMPAALSRTLYLELLSTPSSAHTLLCSLYSRPELKTLPLVDFIQAAEAHANVQSSLLIAQFLFDDLKKRPIGTITATEETNNNIFTLLFHIAGMADMEAKEVFTKLIKMKQLSAYISKQGLSLLNYYFLPYKFIEPACPYVKNDSAKVIEGIEQFEKTRLEEKPPEKKFPDFSYLHAFLYFVSSELDETEFKKLAAWLLQKDASTLDVAQLASYYDFLCNKLSTEIKKSSNPNEVLNVQDLFVNWYFSPLFFNCSPRFDAWPLPINTLYKQFKTKHTPSFRLRCIMEQDVVPVQNFNKEKAQDLVWIINACLKHETAFGIQKAISFLQKRAGSILKEAIDELGEICSGLITFCLNNPHIDAWQQLIDAILHLYMRTDLHTAPHNNVLWQETLGGSLFLLAGTLFITNKSAYYYLLYHMAKERNRVPSTELMLNTILSEYISILMTEARTDMYEKLVDLLHLPKESFISDEKPECINFHEKLTAFLGSLPSGESGVAFYNMVDLFFFAFGKHMINNASETLSFMRRNLKAASFLQDLMVIVYKNGHLNPESYKVCWQLLTATRLLGQENCMKK